LSVQVSKRILLSWSSGKDSAWALHLLRQQSDVEVASLLTTIDEQFDRVVTPAANQVMSKRIAKKQRMQWSQRGAHPSLQVRTRVLNGDWGEAFRTWYPGFRRQAQSAVASPPGI
jgi:hypothetical protein